MTITRIEARTQRYGIDVFFRNLILCVVNVVGAHAVQNSTHTKAFVAAARTAGFNVEKLNDFLVEHYSLLTPTDKELLASKLSHAQTLHNVMSQGPDKLKHDDKPAGAEEEKRILFLLHEIPVHKPEELPALVESVNVRLKRHVKRTTSTLAKLSAHHRHLQHAGAEVDHVADDLEVERMSELERDVLLWKPKLMEFESYVQAAENLRKVSMQLRKLTNNYAGARRLELEMKVQFVANALGLRLGLYRHQLDLIEK